MIGIGSRPSIQFPRKDPATYLLRTRDGRPLALLSLSEVADLRHTGHRLRARCPVHGSNRQRSLSIHPATGWGRCYACHASVLLMELNPSDAETVLRRRGRFVSIRPSPLTAEPSAPTFPVARLTAPQADAATQMRPAPDTAPPASVPAGSTAPPWQRRERLALYQLEAAMQHALATLAYADCWQAQAYLHERQIPLDLALEQGVGYLPEALAAEAGLSRFQLERWSNRLIFPLYAQEGRGYIGRTLWRWQLGMSETVHKALLDDLAEAPPRWLKTSPAGHFSVPPVQLEACVVLVEGAFDRLALLSAGFAPEEVVAVVGTQADASWFPEQVKAVLLALDADVAGQEASERLRVRLSAHLLVGICPAPTDGGGKDWSERWRRLGRQGVAELYDAYARLRDRI